MSSVTAGLLVLLVSTSFLAGLVWTVQVVHYPLFAGVGDEVFATYEGDHTRRLGLVVTLPWAVHGLATAWLLVQDLPRALVLLAAALAATTVVVTLGWSIPAHRVLAAGFDADAHARLVRTNWLRTFAWTGNAAVAVALLVHHLSST